MRNKDNLLETDRLLIRKFQLEDSNDLFEYLSLSEVYIFEPGNPVTLEQAKEMCLERSKGNNFYAVELKDEHKMIGHLYFDQIQPLEFMTWELGYIFNPKYQGNGYCTEAARKIIDHAFKDLHAHRITAFCDPINTASWHVLEKLGLRKEGYFREKAFFRKNKENSPIWHDCYAYGLLDRDYHGQ
jgi:RimJ/RimL family protein N-acetyltransferase